MHRAYHRLHNVVDQLATILLDFDNTFKIAPPKFLIESDIFRLTKQHGKLHFRKSCHHACNSFHHNSPDAGSLSRRHRHYTSHPSDLHKVAVE